MSGDDIKPENFLAACGQGNSTFVEEYIRRYPEKGQYEMFDDRKWGPLHTAIAGNSLECVELLLKSGLVNTRMKSIQGQTGLHLAVDLGSSPKIIKALLTTDFELINVRDRWPTYPLHKAVMKRELVMVRTIIETLKELKVKYVDRTNRDGDNSLLLATQRGDVQMVEYLLTTGIQNVRHTNLRGLNAAGYILAENCHIDQTNRFEIFKKLVPLTYNLAARDCMQQMLRLFIFVCQHHYDNIFTWIMEEFYLSDLNEHRDIVRKTLSYWPPQATVQFVFALHSKIDRYAYMGKVNGKSISSDKLYSNFYQKLLKLYKDDRDLYTEVCEIIRPKLDIGYTHNAMCKLVRNSQLDGMQLQCEYIEMLDILQVGNLVSIRMLSFDIEMAGKPFVPFMNKFIPMLMPFSTAPTADVYLQGNILYEFHLKRKSNEFAVSKHLERFCINGEFRKNCDLKKLCRAAIRRSLFPGMDSQDELNHELLYRVKSLPVPSIIKNFLLYNYSDYDFKC